MIIILGEKLMGNGSVAPTIPSSSLSLDRNFKSYLIASSASAETLDADCALFGIKVLL